VGDLENRRGARTKTSALTQRGEIDPVGDEAHLERVIRIVRAEGELPVSREPG